VRQLNLGNGSAAAASATPAQQAWQRRSSPGPSSIASAWSARP